MINTLMNLLRALLILLPFLVFTLLNSKANLKEEIRHRQFLMPILALIYSLILMLLLKKLGDLAFRLIDLLPELLARLAGTVEGWLGGRLAGLSNLIARLGELVESLLRRLNLEMLIFAVLNAALMLAHIIVKRILTLILKGIFKKSTPFAENIVGLFYEHDPKQKRWFVMPRFSQARTYLKTFYWTAVIVSTLAAMVSVELFRKGLLSAPFYPVFGVIILGEFYFFLNGATKQETETSIDGEDDDSNTVGNYALLRQPLRKLFGDKLVTENTTVTDNILGQFSNDELLLSMEQSGDSKVEAYGAYMRRRLNDGQELDHNYLMSGLDLLQGKSILFNNPFYYDLIPYAFYAINRTLLRHKKVLIVLGRHGAEDEIRDWCEAGLTAITNVRGMWRIGVLTDDNQDLDVGIVTRSCVHDTGMHERNDRFFHDVEFMVLIEPSRLITTAQLGLNSLIRHCCRRGKQITFCSTDRNCDGLVDALSHVLMTSIAEVAATNRHEGTCSYMCWESDREHLQHRMLPNLSRYLGMGTELSFAALKNQVSKTAWYGGEAFPVVDMHWIVKQYYYELLHYADLPTTQDAIDEYFRVSSSLWNAKIAENSYLTVEDESCNIFEIKRSFSTRATTQSLINIISPDYLLKDYMAANDGIFNADPKAIPYIVADYARTRRNVALRLCLRMCGGMVSSEDIRRELMLVNVVSGDLIASLWHELCACTQPIGDVRRDDLGAEVLVRYVDGKEYVFSRSTIRRRRKYSVETGLMEDLYYINDSAFKTILLRDLQNATYIAEDEQGRQRYLGTELRGHIFQRYLPGQFFTFNGKYYEMQAVTADGQVLLRRAADHITGRPAYRQIRNYTISQAADSEGMGECRSIGGISVHRQYADIRVDTPAYWQLGRHSDFHSAQKITINGIPQREYFNKPILRIDFDGAPEEVTAESLRTLTLLFNETFRTLFAENHHFISAVMAGDPEAPITCGLAGENGFTPNEKAIYIIEDSQLDIGLLVAVERNLQRIFSIVCDYLDWHFDALETSMNPSAPSEPEDHTIPAEQQDQPKGVKKVFRKIGSFFKKIGAAIGGFFRKLFRRKKKQAAPEQPETDLPVEEIGADIPDEDAPIREEIPAPAEKDTVDEAFPAEEEEFAPLMSVSTTEEEEQPASAEPDFEFEPEQVISPNQLPERKPYHLRHYLLYGGTEMPEGLDPSGALGLLKGLGFDNSSLKQARSGKDVAELIEKNYVPNRDGVHYCDFCGVELVGTEYDVLSDGRERCMSCSRTAVKSAKEFESMYRTIARNMEAFYGASITVPVKVQMVNAKTLHKRLGKTFVPTGKPDGRVLGVAIKDKSGYSILVENGSPRMASIMTMAHEMTHIWQYLNWDRKAIRQKYGAAQELEIYEGMAKWSEMQYAYLIGEPATAKREEIITRLRQDEYGQGFNKYVKRYPLTTGTHLKGATPFEDKITPL